MAFVDNRIGSHPSLISSLKDVLVSRQGHASGDHPDQAHAERGAEREAIGVAGQQEHAEEEVSTSLPQSSTSLPQVVDGRPCVLVTNDDGIHAPGLRALVETLVDSGSCNVFVCAPDRNKSGVGHSVTLREKIAVSSIDMKGAIAYEVSGTPADCVSLGLSGLLFPERSIALVLSGINRGSNCGYHIFYSGTVAGAREALICGVPSISLSFNWKKGESSERDFKVAAALCLPLIFAALRDIDTGVFPRKIYLNVDVPSNPSKHKGYRITKQGAARLAIKWVPVSSQKALPVCRENAIGIRLAQLGLAASAVGAARRINSPAKNVEIESVAGPENSPQSNGQKKLYFQNEYGEIELGDDNLDYDFGALHEGYITITPLGLSSSHLDEETFGSARNWILSFVDSSASSAL